MYIVYEVRPSVVMAKKQSHAGLGRPAVLLPSRDKAQIKGHPFTVHDAGCDLFTAVHTTYIRVRSYRQPVLVKKWDEDTKAHSEKVWFPGRSQRPRDVRPNSDFQRAVHY